MSDRRICVSMAFEDYEAWMPVGDRWDIVGAWRVGTDLVVSAGYPPIAPPGVDAPLCHIELWPDVLAERIWINGRGY